MRTLSYVLISCLSQAWAATIELKIGGALSLTGSKAGSGKACRDGWMLWANRLNEIGGITLTNGDVVKVKMPLDLRDDLSSKTGTEALLESMLNSTNAAYAALDFVIGPFSSGFTGVNAAVSKRFSKILFSHGASESLYDKQNGYIFSVLTPGRSYMSSGLTALYASGARSVIFMHEQKSFSASVCEGGNSTAYALGMNVKAYFSYPAGTQNFAEYIFAVKKENPDVLVGCGHKSDVTYVIGQAVLMSVEPKAMLFTHVADKSAVTSIGARSHAMLSPTQWEKASSASDDDDFFGGANDYNTRFNDAYGYEPPYTAAYASAMGYLLQKAIEAADSVDTEAVRAKLYTVDFKSFYGPIKLEDDPTVSNTNPYGLIGVMPMRPMVTTQIQFGQIGVVAPPSEASMSVMYPAPSWNDKLLLNYPCPTGEEEDSSTGTCNKCQVGTYRDESLLACSPCLPGSFSNSIGATACALCSNGYVAANKSSTSCVACGPGYIAAERGMATCLACPAGTYINANGAVECALCPVGRYNSFKGQTECTACGDEFTTEGGGMREPTDCVCPEGNYMNLQGECVTCSAAFDCAIGSAEVNYDRTSAVARYPRAKPSYMVFPEDFLTPYWCVDADTCAGGMPGCSNGLVGVGCARCPEGEVDFGGGCIQCGTGHRLYGVGFLIFLILFTFVLYKISNPEHCWRLYPKESIGILGEMMFEVAQVFGNLQGLALTWDKFPSIVPWFRDTAGAFNIDVSTMAPLPCVLFGSSDSQNYVIMAFAIPAITIMVWIVHACTQVLPQKWRWVRPKTMNTCGKLWNTFFVSQAFFAITPFICRAHPAPNAMQSSLTDYPGTLCYAGGHHTYMVVGGVINVLLCAGFVSILAYIVKKLPAIFAHPDHDVLLVKYVFVIEDFQIETYFFLLPAKVFEVALALVMVVSPNSTHFQLFLFILCIVLFLSLHYRFWPFKLPALNLLYAVLMMQFVCLLTLAMLVVDEKEVPPTPTAAIAAICAMSLILTGIVSVLILANFFIRGKEGAIYGILELRHHPDRDAIAQEWAVVFEHVSPQYLSENMPDWSIYDVTKLERVMFMLKTGVHHAEVKGTLSKSSSKTNLADDEIADV